jgi:hypothetical protein
MTSTPTLENKDINSQENNRKYFDLFKEKISK